MTLHNFRVYWLKVQSHPYSCEKSETMPWEIMLNNVLIIQSTLFLYGFMLDVSIKSIWQIDWNSNRFRSWYYPHRTSVWRVRPTACGRVLISGWSWYDVKFIKNAALEGLYIEFDILAINDWECQIALLLCCSRLVKLNVKLLK